MGLRRRGILRPGEKVRGNGEKVGDEGAGVFAALRALACVSLGRWVRSDSVFFFVFFIRCCCCCYRTLIFPLHKSSPPILFFLVFPTVTEVEGFTTQKARLTPGGHG